MTVRVFLPADSKVAVGGTIVLEPSESHYLVRVRRVRVGASIDALDGVSRAFRATVVVADPGASRIALVEERPPPTSAWLGLGLGLPATTATAAAVAAACEAGATEIVMIRCTHSPAPTPTPDRLERVVRAAQRQCGRARAPVISGPIDLQTWLDTACDHPGYFGAPGTCSPPPERAPGPRRGARLLIGPEAGLMPAEVSAATQSGLRPLGLGPHILRTETAVVAGLAVLQSWLTARSTSDGARRRS